MDWDTFYFEHWETDPATAGTVPTHEDYQDWLFGVAETAIGME